MRIGFADAGFVDAFHAVGSQDSNWYILCDNCFPVPHICIKGFFPEIIVLEWICIRSIQKPICTVPAADCVCDDCKGKNWNAILFRESNRGRGRVDGGFQGAMEGWEGELEVDGVIWSRGLNGVVFEYGLDRQGAV